MDHVKRRRRQLHRLRSECPDPSVAYNQNEWVWEAAAFRRIIPDAVHTDKHRPAPTDR